MKKEMLISAFFSSPNLFPHLHKPLFSWTSSFHELLHRHPPTLECTWNMNSTWINALKHPCIRPHFLEAELWWLIPFEQQPQVDWLLSWTSMQTSTYTRMCLKLELNTDWRTRTPTHTATFSEGKTLATDPLWTADHVFTLATCNSRPCLHSRCTQQQTMHLGSWVLELRTWVLTSFVSGKLRTWVPAVICVWQCN